MTALRRLWVFPATAALACLVGATGLLGSSGCGGECLCDVAGVWCRIGLQKMAVCGPDKVTASASCFDAGGNPEDMLCPGGAADGGASGETEGEPFEPGASIHVDAATGAYVIDAEFVAQVRANTALLYSDTTRLEHQPREGYYLVSADGQLSRAMGWRLGDVIIGVNDHDLGNLDSVLDAFVALEHQTQFALDLERDGRLVTLTYLIQ